MCPGAPFSLALYVVANSLSSPVGINHGPAPIGYAGRGTTSKPTRLIQFAGVHGLTNTPAPTDALPGPHHSRPRRYWLERKPQTLRSPASTQSTGTLE